VIEDGEESHLWDTELEKLFGLKEHYLDVAGLGSTRRRRLLGKAWCIPVIEDLLQPLVPLFKCLKETD